MQKAKIISIVCLLLFLSLITTSTVHGLEPRDENYYFIEEDEKITNFESLDRVLDNIDTDRAIKSWSWGIEGTTYSPSQVSGTAKIINNLERNPTFIAPSIVDDSSYKEIVTLKALAIYRGGDNYSYDSMEIHIRNSLEARPGGPYEVVEGESILLNDDHSSGVEKQYNWGIRNPISGMSLTDSVNQAPTFHAPPDIEKDKKFTVSLYLTSEHPGYGKYGGKKYSESTTTVTVLDTDLKAEINDRVATESGQITLDSQSSGYIKNYKWEIIKDPTDEAYLENKNGSKAIFYAPNTVKEETEIFVKLTVSNPYKKDSDNAKITINATPPAAPENLEVQGKLKATEISTLNPSLSAAFMSENPHDQGENVEIHVQKDGEKYWKVVKSVSKTVGERINIDYSGKILIPNENYSWKIRFHDGAEWGPWADSSFVMSDLLSFNQSESIELLRKMEKNKRVKTVEEALDKNENATLKVVRNLSSMTLATLIANIASSPNSPAEAAIILDYLGENKAISTVRGMVAFQRFQAINDIFAQENHLANDKVNTLYQSLLPEEKEVLKKHLSEDVKGRISGIGGGDGGFGIMTILKIVLAAGAIILVLRYRTQLVGMVMGGKEKSREYEKILKKFIKSDKERMAIRADMPPGKIANSTQEAIREMNMEDRVKLGKKKDRIYLVRRA